VSNPVRALVPTLDGPIAIALSRTSAPLTLTELTRLLHPSSKSGIRSSCLRLVSQGLVLAVPGGYVINREHLAFPAVEHLAHMRRELLERIGQFADEWSEPPLLLGVFGSYARHDGDEVSDIDVLCVCKSDVAGEQCSELAERVRAWTGNTCHVLTFTPTDIHRLHKNKERILEEWDRDLLVIRGNVEVLGARS
jgi:predicted nucleotidyltransferase